MKLRATNILTKQYTRRGETFAMPSILQDPDIVVPPSELQHLLSLSDDDISLEQSLNDQLQSKYTLLHPCVRKDFYKLLVPGVQYLERLTQKNIDKIMEEVDHSVTVHLGTDSEKWCEMGVFDTVEKIAVQVSARFITGLPLCASYKPILLHTVANL